MVWIRNLVRFITAGQLDRWNINLARDNWSIFIHPFAQSTVEDSHIACAEVTEQKSGSWRGEYPNLVVADNTVASLDVQRLHLFIEAFEAGKSIDILAGLGNLSKVKQHSVSSESLFLE